MLVFYLEELERFQLLVENIQNFNFQQKNKRGVYFNWHQWVAKNGLKWTERDLNPSTLRNLTGRSNPRASPWQTRVKFLDPWYVLMWLSMQLVSSYVASPHLAVWLREAVPVKGLHPRYHRVSSSSLVGVSGYITDGLGFKYNPYELLLFPHLKFLMILL